MSNLADLIRRMAAAGATPEAIAIAVEAIEVAEQRDADRRSQAAARKRRSRERLSCDGHGAVAGRSQDNAVTVTGQSQDPPPPSSSSPTPPLTTTPTTPPNSGAVAPSLGGAREKAPKRGSRLPADWTPTPEDRNAAVSIGLRPADVASEAARFRDYWSAKAGKDAVKLDWSATWRNWCRNAVQRGPSRPPPGPPAQRRNPFFALAEELLDDQQFPDADDLFPEPAGSRRGADLEGVRSSGVVDGRPDEAFDLIPPRIERR
ncbi:hypothetical protein [Blastochloris tepida]|uniref:Uncharacterized protein n=1 Tax=Blastochloris tepida TaxID=2233851 RepID=A0A348FZD5_9HYPH|nr:hypothetical protein [Blastochloris tepida]BBF92668.1 hypothetical protein BLTE_13530 [Blastochloris tepida]